MLHHKRNRFRQFNWFDNVSNGIDKAKVDNTENDFMMLENISKNNKNFKNQKKFGKSVFLFSNNNVQASISNSQSLPSFSTQQQNQEIKNKTKATNTVDEQEYSNKQKQLPFSSSSSATFSATLVATVIINNILNIFDN